MNNLRNYVILQQSHNNAKLIKGWVFQTRTSPAMLAHGTIL